MSNIKLGSMINHYRKINGWTMKELGEKMDKTESAISLWISEKRSPMVEDLEKLSNLFNVSPEILMFGETQTETVKKISSISNKLKDERQENVLYFTKQQLEEQNKEIEKQKIITLENKNSSDVDDDGIDWNEWVAFDGRPMSDHDKQVIKEHLGDELKD